MNSVFDLNKIFLHSDKISDEGVYRQSLKASWIDTKLGPMIAISDETNLYLLEFADGKGLKRKIERLKRATKAVIIQKSTALIESVALELEFYFDRKIRQFMTPLHFLGSLFQNLVYEELMRIPYGQTRNYKAQASALGKSKAYRAVANANAANQFSIIVPCHRVINSNGALGGYSGGITRKQWLINHERCHV
ncbi:methylated-DNA--protein-cysteine methyltransferase [Holospora elegans E1]|uniref:methylated-DNA--[protein]-cysteine S-methyltransferase n=1 Tax=Holospora elegans E1 TaxID=1427503 RepID=A0A023DWM1_9PROT|nr:methylated-DNA--[protein]-cysteine S-methyltransferase [Holospora elegans]GAJ45696.1 methylated-DNA--protein-cysteine methyltransferase [Holospora elegans E1]